MQVNSFWMKHFKKKNAQFFLLEFLVSKEQLSAHVQFTSSEFVRYWNSCHIITVPMEKFPLCLPLNFFHSAVQAEILNKNI